MKEAHKLIEDTVNMVDECQSSIDTINREANKRIKMFAILLFGITLLITTILIIFL